MCTVFTVNDKHRRLMAKNYDCFIDEGMIFTNKRGMKKASLVMLPEKVLTWTAQYGSVTFSQSGKGMPVSGVNEKGLIVEQATLPETIYPNDERPAISCLEAAQYILDTCETTRQAIAAFDNFRISQNSGKLHFFIMDDQGERAVVEFLQGKMNVIGEDRLIPLITNSAYEDLVSGKEQYSSDYEADSFRRYHIVKEELAKEEKQQTEKITVERTFEILEKAKRKDTVWHTVYDLAQKKLFFKAAGQTVKVIDLVAIDYSEPAASYLYDVKDKSESFEWQPYTRAENRRNIEGFYGNPTVLALFHLPDAKFMVDAFDNHIQAIEEGKL